MVARVKQVGIESRSKDLFLTFMIVCAFAVYFMPAGYAVNTQIYRVWVALVVVISAVSIIVYLVKCKISLRWISISFAITFYYLITTVLLNSGGGILGNGFNVIKLVGFVSLLEYGFLHDEEKFLKSFLIAGVLMCIVNYVTFLQYGHLRFGMRLFVADGEAFKAIPWLFFSHDNGTLFYYLPVMVGLWYYAIEINRKSLVIALLFTVATIYMYIRLASMTAMASTIVVAIVSCVVFYMHRSGIRYLKHHSLLTYKTILIIGIIINLAIVIFSTSSQMGIIASIMNKPVDLSGRIFIWERASQHIFDNLVIGLGQESGAQTILRLGLNHAHNLSIQILYCSGLVGAALFIAAFLKCDLPKEQRGVLTVGQAFILFAIVVFFTASSFDWYLSFPAPLFMFILYSYSYKFRESNQLLGYTDE